MKDTILPLFLNDAVPEEHKNGIDMNRDLLRRSHVLVVCGQTVTEAMKNDIAVAQRLGSPPQRWMERRYLVDASQTEKERKRLEARNQEIDGMFFKPAYR